MVVAFSTMFKALLNPPPPSKFALFSLFCKISNLSCTFVWFKPSGITNKQKTFIFGGWKRHRGQFFQSSSIEDNQWLPKLWFVGKINVLTPNSCLLFLVRVLKIYHVRAKLTKQNILVYNIRYSVTCYNCKSWKKQIVANFISFNNFS